MEFVLCPIKTHRVQHLSVIRDDDLRGRLHERVAGVRRPYPAILMPVPVGVMSPVQRAGSNRLNVGGDSPPFSDYIAPSYLAFTLRGLTRQCLPHNQTDPRHWEEEVGRMA